MKPVTKTERNRAIVYWGTAALLAFELGLGGVWDVLKVPQVRGVMDRLGYPLISLSFWESGSSWVPLR